MDYLALFFLIIVIIYLLVIYKKEGDKLKQLEHQMLEENEEIKNKCTEQNKFYGSFVVAGISFYKDNIKKILNTNKSSDSGYVYDVRTDYVSLIFEPNNQHDPNAIAVYMDSQKIGYVPSDLTASVRELKNNNNWFVGTITCGDKYTDDGIAEYNFKCEVRLEDAC